MDTLEKTIILEAKNLAVGYGAGKTKVSVAEEINFALRKGELVGLVGANGIGKSTLLRTLMGMQPPLAGKIRLQGKDLQAYSAFQLATLASVVLTEPPATKNLSVKELVSLGRQPYTNWIGKLSKTDRNIVETALQTTETLSLANRKCFELSDGQMQKVAIARALAQNTPVMFLDEPTTHLDLYHRAYVLKLLKDLSQNTGKTILFSTHEIDLAIQLADKIIIMTREQTFFDDPCSLIEAGRFNSLFPSETIGFDSQTGRFTIRK